MLDFETQAQNIISQYLSKDGVEKTALDNFCPNIETLSDYLDKELISTETFDSLCHIMLHTLPGKIRLNDKFILKMSLEDDKVKTELVAI